MLKIVQKDAMPGPRRGRQPSNKAYKDNLNPIRFIPQCNHILMSREFGEIKCHICLQVPPLKFVYACRQDLWQRQIKRWQRDVENNVPHKLADNLREAVVQARDLEMHPSVILSLRRGEYTLREAQTLISQRINVVQTIAAVSTPQKQAEYASRMVRMPRTARMAIISEGDEGAAVNILPGSSNSQFHYNPVLHSRPFSIIPPPCLLKVCHNCRAQLRERIFVPLDALHRATDSYCRGSPPKPQRVLNATVLKSLDLAKIISMAGVQDPDFAGFDYDTHSSSIISGSEYSDEFPEDDSFLAPPDPELAQRRWSSDEQDQLAREYSSLCILNHQASESKSAQTTPSPAHHAIADASTPMSTYNTGSSATSSSSAAAMTPLTPFPHGGEETAEECFEDSFERMVREASSASIINVSKVVLPEGQDWPLTSNVERDPFQEESRTQISGGIALTEEAVNTGLCDVLTG